METRVERCLSSQENIISGYFEKKCCESSSGCSAALETHVERTSECCVHMDVSMCVVVVDSTRGTLLIWTKASDINRQKGAHSGVWGERV